MYSALSFSYRNNVTGYDSLVTPQQEASNYSRSLGASDFEDSVNLNHDEMPERHHPSDHSEEHKSTDFEEEPDDLYTTEEFVVPATQRVQ